MQQYVETKAQYEDHIVLFRMGDFYETFYDDAKAASQILGITLTARDREKKVPMAGIPFHALDNYLNKLIDANQKVVLVEQLEDPKEAKGIVKRGIVKIFTPGTTPTTKDLRKNIFIVSVYKNKNYEIAFSDLNEGVIKFVEFKNVNDFFNNILLLEPKEIILAKDNFPETEFNYLKDNLKRSLINNLENSEFDSVNYNKEIIHENIHSQIKKSKKKSLFGLLNYLANTQRTHLGHLLDIREHTTKDYVKLDYNVVRNLELLDGQRPDAVPLLKILDNCSTLSGSKLLRQWLITPLTDLKKIEKRLDALQEFKELGLQKIQRFQNDLQESSDLNRLSSRIGLSTANARDLRNLVDSIKSIFSFSKKLNNEQNIPTISNCIKTILSEIKKSQNILSQINSTIVDLPPITVREGGMIKPEYSEELNELYKLKNGGKEWLKSFEQDQIKQTGISTLKVRFNKVFGYYIEISKGNASKAPEEYIRKQTLVNAERYITPELKEYEAKVLGAEDQINKLEFRIFCELLETCKTILPSIQKICEQVSELDVFLSLASVSINENWIRPKVHENFETNIENGRHPVIECLLKKSGKPFVKNSYTSDENSTLQIITGPNMGGKSTYLRQVALITLLAQVGCFVPADKAEISIVDRIFTRVGASDNLSAGESTFMVEMLEAAEIIKSSTERSLVILDEVGRGTSTFDGMSLAWAICEHLANTKCKTLFATHYHEITELANKYTNIKNLAVKVIDYQGEIVFMHQIYSGKADRSYGIHVAKLAGMPPSVIKKAEQVLKLLEKEKNTLQPKPQDLFTNVDETESINEVDSNSIKSKLESIDLDKTTPIEAWEILNKLKKELN